MEQPEQVKQLESRLLAEKRLPHWITNTSLID